MPEAFLRVDGKRTGFLLVKWTEANEPSPGLPQADVRRYEIDNIRATAYLFEVPATTGHSFYLRPGLAARRAHPRGQADTLLAF